MCMFIPTTYIAGWESKEKQAGFTHMCVFSDVGTSSIEWYEWYAGGKHLLPTRSYRLLKNRLDNVYSLSAAAGCRYNKYSARRMQRINWDLFNHPLPSLTKSKFLSRKNSFEMNHHSLQTHLVKSGEHCNKSAVYQENAATFRNQFFEQLTTFSQRWRDQNLLLLLITQSLPSLLTQLRPRVLFSFFLGFGLLISILDLTLQIGIVYLFLDGSEKENEKEEPLKEKKERRTRRQKEKRSFKTFLLKFSFLLFFFLSSSHSFILFQAQLASRGNFIQRGGRFLPPLILMMTRTRTSTTTKIATAIFFFTRLNCEKWKYVHRVTTNKATTVIITQSIVCADNTAAVQWRWGWWK